MTGQHAWTTQPSSPVVLAFLQSSARYRRAQVLQQSPAPANAPSIITRSSECATGSREPETGCFCFRNLSTCQQAAICDRVISTAPLRLLPPTLSGDAPAPIHPMCSAEGATTKKIAPIGAP